MVNILPSFWLVNNTSTVLHCWIRHCSHKCMKLFEGCYSHRKY